MATPRAVVTKTLNAHSVSDFRVACMMRDSGIFDESIVPLLALRVQFVLDRVQAHLRVASAQVSCFLQLPEAISG